MVMKIEEQFAKTDLSVFKQKPLEILIKGIYKYQKFKRNVIVEKINTVHFKPSTVSTYIGWVKAYLRHGTKDKQCGSSIYTLLDELKSQHAPILTPSEKERERILPPRKKTTPQSSPTPQVEIEPEPQKLVEVLPTQYGIKTENTIKLFLSKECCDAYIQAYREFDKDKELEVVKLKYRVL